MSPRVLAVVQVRLGSTRLPGKALSDVGGQPMLGHVLRRAAAIPSVDQLVIATTRRSEDDALVEFAQSANVPCVRGSTSDVLDRFRAAALEFSAQTVLRITGDCPLIDPRVSGLVVDEFLRHDGTVDYVSNVQPVTYPDGLDTEIFSMAALERAWREARLPSDREHVTTYMRESRDLTNGFRRANVAHSEDLSNHRWTVDEARDLEFVRAVYAALSPDGRRIFGMDEILSLIRTRPDLLTLNVGIPRNEGLRRSQLADQDHLKSGA